MVFLSQSHQIFVLHNEFLLKKKKITFYNAKEKKVSLFSSSEQCLTDMDERTTNLWWCNYFLWCIKQVVAACQRVDTIIHVL